MATQNPAQDFPARQEVPDITTVRIGVTGHRSLKNPELIQQSVREMLAKLDAFFHGKPHRYRVISPLAEGADRLVARTILAWSDEPSGSSLQAPELMVALPMPEERYFQTFDDKLRDESVREYVDLKKNAVETIQVADTLDRHEAYGKTGRFVCDNCDILVGVWDGKSSRGQGGTADIVKYARSTGCSVIWIHAHSGRIRWFFEEVEDRYGKLRDHAVRSGLEDAILAPLKFTVLPQFVKATNRASYYQKLYIRSGEWAYILSACAVASAAAGWLIGGKKSVFFFLSEIVFIVAIVVLVWPPRFRSWQRMWIDFRFLAERLRASCFLHVAGLEFEPREAHPDLRISWLPVDPTMRALREVWKALPRRQNLGSEADKEKHIKSVTQFLLHAWIDEQQKYYEETGNWNRNWHEGFEIAQLIILSVTLAVALLHVVLELYVTSPIIVASGTLLDLLSAFAVTLPAVAAALAGISVFRHFHRNAERCTNMSDFLKEIGSNMLDAAGLCPSEQQRKPDLTRVLDLVQKADAAMAHEHEGWRVVFGVKLPGPA